MSRFRLAVAGLAFIILALPAAAVAAVQLRGVDATAYPTLHASIYTPGGGGKPALWENGTPVVGFQAQNLGSVKAIATLIDRSQSMRGKPLADASAGARAFVAAKQAPDELSVIAFGSKVSTLSPFSTVRRDADVPLGRLTTDSVRGTALYDAVQLSSQALGVEQNHSSDTANSRARPLITGSWSGPYPIITSFASLLTTKPPMFGVELSR